MNIKRLFVLAILGIIFCFFSIFIYHEKIVSQPPLSVSYNPYEKGIYANGIVESYQINGSNVNIFPQVSGKITHIYVKDGDEVKKGQNLIAIDDSVQKQIVAKDEANINYAKANLNNVEQQLQKTLKSHSINAKSISQNTLDNAINAVKIAEENVKVAISQYNADKAVWDRYMIKAPRDGIILRVLPTVGDYASPQGSYDIYTKAMAPTIQIGNITPYLQVRCYVDEILTPKLPNTKNLQATLFVRGLNNKSIPLEFVNIQPFTIPNIQLSDERNMRVDIRVLPIIFKFTKPKDINIFAGQLVDVYIKGKA